MQPEHVGRPEHVGARSNPNKCRTEQNTLLLPCSIFCVTRKMLKGSSSVKGVIYFKDVVQ